ncbi:uncharacterized protein JN550_005925 [Neoarthrinium moseri]|uniref:uncharacterized protein n=1 Tax=Neoarthrinium moseri TaxID=1658444 RepID=UPI001FDC9224|nr:uncharacterized protein JN550_005925 [Neoarthrinium moseri]KAI1869295.1 hypothetical protein JN550_005925 [Neoarthrinium moseri]
MVNLAVLLTVLQLLLGSMVATSELYAGVYEQHDHERRLSDNAMGQRETRKSLDLGGNKRIPQQQWATYVEVQLKAAPSTRGPKDLPATENQLPAVVDRPAVRRRQEGKTKKNTQPVAAEPPRPPPAGPAKETKQASAGPAEETIAAPADPAQQPKAPPPDPAQPTTAAPPDPGQQTVPPAAPAETVGPNLASMSSSLTSSASSALASVSSSFQGEIASLSSRSSADVAAASSSGASAISSLSVSASSASGAIASSASLAGARAAGASADIEAAVSNSIAASASSAGFAAATASAAASASSAIAAARGSTQSTPSTTSTSNYELAQPSSPGSTSENGIIHVTPGQIAAIVIGTMIGSAILTLIIVYFIGMLRKRRSRSSDESYGDGEESEYNDQMALNPLGQDDGTGRADGYMSRGLNEKGATSWSPTAATTTNRAHGGPKHIPLIPQASQKLQPISHRPSLPPLPEDRGVYHSGNHSSIGFGSTNGLDFSLTDPRLGPQGSMPEQPEPVKLTLAKRLSRGGSQRMAVVRTPSQGGNDASDTLSSPGHARSPSGPDNLYFTISSSVYSPGAGTRPDHVRTLSSDIFPRRKSGIISPLSLNPPTSASSVPRVSALASWGSWGPISPSNPPPMIPYQYQNLASTAAPGPPASRNGNTDPNPTMPAPLTPVNQQRIPDRTQNHIAFLLSQNSQHSPQPSTQLPQQPGAYPGTTTSPEPMVGTAATSHLSPRPLRPIKPLSISPSSPYSSTFERPAQQPAPPSPAFMSPLSPPPRSPLRAARSEQSLRTPTTVSPLTTAPPSQRSSPSADDKAMPPLPLDQSRRRSRSNSSGELEVRVGLAQAVAGLDMLGGGGFGSSAASNGGGSDLTKASSSGVGDTEAGPNRARFTSWLASNDPSSESGSGSPTNTDDPWGRPLPVPRIRRKRSSSTPGPVDYVPEQPRTPGAVPKFSLFPRTGVSEVGASQPSYADDGQRRRSSLGAIAYR